MLIAMLLTGTVAYFAPRFLAYSDKPVKSDAIILFSGQELQARLMEAMQLIKEGFSDYLFVPASFRLYRADKDRTRLTVIRFSDIKPGLDLPRPRKGDELSPSYFKKIRSEYSFPRFYEDTYVEILLAKKAMDACGFRKAIFVSSPYHMRRIKIMTGRVFDSSYDIKFVPSRFEKRFKVSFPSRKDLEHVFTEYIKMIWFLCYHLCDGWRDLCGAR